MASVNWKEIGDRIKSLEEKSETEISSNKPFLIRLDGCSFHTFTKGMERPYDTRMIESMEKTTEDLVKKFHPRTGFCQSDEITLLFPMCDTDKGQRHLYNGRVQKLCSIIASYTSVRFTYHMRMYKWESKFDDRMDEGAIFDARVIIPESDDDVLNAFLWRQQFDCSRNAVMGIAQAHFTHRQLHGKNCKEALSMLVEKGVEIYDGEIPNSFLYGTFIKRKLVAKTAIDRKTGESIKCLRTEIEKLSRKSPVNLDYLLLKYAI